MMVLEWRCTSDGVSGVYQSGGVPVMEYTSDGVRVEMYQ